MILVKIGKGIYGLPPAGRLAYDKLLKILREGGFEPAAHTTGLFCHKTLPVTFCLVVDDFGVKYENKSDVEYLLILLRKTLDDNRGLGGTTLLRR